MFEAQIPEKSQGKAMRRLGKVGPTRKAQWSVVKSHEARQDHGLRG